MSRQPCDGGDGGGGFDNGSLEDGDANTAAGGLTWSDLAEYADSLPLSPRQPAPTAHASGGSGGGGDYYLAILDDAIAQPQPVLMQKEEGAPWRELNDADDDGYLCATKNQFLAEIPAPRDLQGVLPNLECVIAQGTPVDATVTGTIADRHRGDGAKARYIGPTVGGRAAVAREAFSIDILEAKWCTHDDGRRWGLLRFSVRSAIAGKKPGGDRAQNVKLTLRVVAGAQTHDFPVNIRSDKKPGVSGAMLLRAYAHMSPEARLPFLRECRSQVQRDLDTNPPPQKRRRLLHEFSTWSKELTKAEREVDARAAVGAGQDTAAGAGAGVAAPLHAPPVMRGLSSEPAYRSLSPQRVADSLEQDGPVQAQDEDMAALMACLMQELPESDRVELLRIIKLGLEEALASTDSTLTSKRDDLQDIIDKIKRLCL